MTPFLPHRHPKPETKLALRIIWTEKAAIQKWLPKAMKTPNTDCGDSAAGEMLFLQYLRAEFACQSQHEKGRVHGHAHAIPDRQLSVAGCLASQLSLLG